MTTTTTTRHDGSRAATCMICAIVKAVNDLAAERNEARR